VCRDRSGKNEVSDLSDPKERRDEALVPQSTRGLATRSSALVRRGLEDIHKGRVSDSWNELQRLARELVFEAVNNFGMEFVLIPAGKFMMGSEARDDENPIHEVSISSPFYMGRYRVTQAQWRQIMGVAPAEFTDDNDPVRGVSWDDAHEFINRLNLIDEPVHLLDERRVQFEYRLPSEAEWEYACRAGLPGDVTGDVYFMDIYGDAPRGQSVLPIGEKRPNAFGLYDMLVGFKEWCEDRYHVNYDNAPADGSAWGEVAGHENRVPQMNRVARGAFSGSPTEYWRASARSWAAPSSRGIVFGLRIVAVER
jgi:formylglycine-generating enzyme required for sulfatase activity